MSSDTKDSAVVVIPQEDGLDSFLTYLAPKHKIFAGRYRLPGGRIKSGEDPGTALKRELEEEYGIELFNISVHYQKSNVLGGVIYLCSAQRNGIPKPLEKDVGVVEWQTAQEIFSSNMVPNCKLAICAYLIDRNPDSIGALHPTIVMDQEFLDTVTSQASGLYKKLNQHSSS